MKIQNTTNTLKGKKSLLIGLSAFLIVGVGVMISAMGIDNGRLLSQFSGTNVTPATASVMWSASPNNPYLTSVGSYNTRLDMIIKSAFARGSSLPVANFQIYLDNLSAGMVSISNRPDYSNDKDVKNMIGYISFEMNDAKASFSNSNGFLNTYSSMVEDAFSRSNSGSVTYPNMGDDARTTPLIQGTVTTEKSVKTENVITSCPVGMSVINGLCSLPVCTSSQLRSPTGSCYDCPSGTTLNSSKTECIKTLVLPGENAYMLKHDNRIYFKVGKDLGYNSCAIAYTDDAVPFSISSNGSSISQKNASYSSISKKPDGSFEANSIFGLNGFKSAEVYVNIYCSKTNSRVDEERIFPLTQIKNMGDSPITTISLFKIDSKNGIRADQYIANGPLCTEVTKDTCARVIQARGIPKTVSWYTQERNFYGSLEWKASQSFGSEGLLGLTCTYNSNTYNQANAGSFTYKSGTTKEFYFAQEYGSQNPTIFCY